MKYRTSVEALAARIASSEPLITPNILPQLEALLQNLKDKTSSNNEDCVLGSFSVDKTLSGGHSLPITNVSIDKHGQMWESQTKLIKTTWNCEFIFEMKINNN